MQKLNKNVFLVSINTKSFQHLAPHVVTSVFIKVKFYLFEEFNWKVITHFSMESRFFMFPLLREAVFWEKIAFLVLKSSLQTKISFYLDILSIIKLYNYLI